MQNQDARSECSLIGGVLAALSHLTGSAARVVGIHDHMQQQSFILHLSAHCHAVRVPYCLMHADRQPVTL
jgi:hypothetical protein